MKCVCYCFSSNKTNVLLDFRSEIAPNAPFGSTHFDCVSLHSIIAVIDDVEIAMSIEKQTHRSLQLVRSFSLTHRREKNASHDDFHYQPRKQCLHHSRRNLQSGRVDDRHTLVRDLRRPSLRTVSICLLLLKERNESFIQVQKSRFTSPGNTHCSDEYFQRASLE